MKALLIFASVFASAAFATPNLIETGTWKVRCLTFTTGPSGNDVHTLSHGEYQLVMDKNTPMTVLYKDGNLEFKTWVTHFVPEDRPEYASNLWQMGVFKNGKYVGGSSSEFIDELPKGLQVVLKNMTKVKGPPKVSMSCRRGDI